MTHQGRGLGRRQALAGGAAMLLGARAARAAAPDPAMLAAARAEGPLVIIHGDQEADVVDFFGRFTARFGIQIQQQRIMSGAAMPRLEAEFRANAVDTDILWAADYGLMERLNGRGRLLRYESPEIAAYAPEFRSAVPGFWTTYYLNMTPPMYDPRRLDPAIAPKTWMDLLDPRWKGQLGFQKTAAGTSFSFWYNLRPLLPADYWTRLAAQNPRGYDSSTQILSDLQNGNLLIGAATSLFQYVKAARSPVPVNVVFPPEGVPSNIIVTGILAPTKRPNAAKIFTDFLLSAEGQTIWNSIQGSASARTDVQIEGLPDLSKVRKLVPTDLDDYGSNAQRQRYVPIWNRIIGL